MKKTYKIDVDCANCANKMEDAARKTPGVTAATVNFMALKMIVEFEEGQDPRPSWSRCGRTAKGGGRLRDLPVSCLVSKSRPKSCRLRGDFSQQ